jgi:DNA-binding NarL/FixJ family response regulator
MTKRELLRQRYADLEKAPIEFGVTVHQMTTILQDLADGRDKRQIAVKLRVAARTIDNKLVHIRNFMGVETTAAAVAVGLRTRRIE